jgi:filamin
MDLADQWLNVPKLLTPEEIVNPNVDEQSMMTYLSQFPNAKLKPGAPLRQKTNPSKVRAYGPGKIRWTDSNNQSEIKLSNGN